MGLLRCNECGEIIPFRYGEPTLEGIERHEALCLRGILRRVHQHLLQHRRKLDTPVLVSIERALGMRGAGQES